MDYALIAIMTGSISIGACCLCIIIAIVCGFACGKVYQMRLDGKEFKHYQSQYDVNNMNEDQI